LTQRRKDSDGLWSEQGETPGPVPNRDEDPTAPMFLDVRSLPELLSLNKRVARLEDRVFSAPGPGPSVIVLGDALAERTQIVEWLRSLAPELEFSAYGITLADAIQGGAHHVPVRR